MTHLPRGIGLPQSKGGGRVTLACLGMPHRLILGCSSQGKQDVQTPGGKARSVQWPGHPQATRATLPWPQLERTLGSSPTCLLHTAPGRPRCSAAGRAPAGGAGWPPGAGPAGGCCTRCPNQTWRQDGKAASFCRHGSGGGEGTTWRAGARRACSKASNRANEPVRSPTRPLRAASRVPRACDGRLGAALRVRPLQQPQQVVICRLSTRPARNEVLGRLAGPTHSLPPMRMRRPLRFSTARSGVHTNVYHHQ